jgi:NodT family efflux transporter outer membrane factor (OMF) lipoprotein
MLFKTRFGLQYSIFEFLNSEGGIMESKAIDQGRVPKDHGSQPNRLPSNGLGGSPVRRVFLRVLAVFVGLGFGFTGCTMVGPNYVRPQAPVEQKWIESEDPKIKSVLADLSTWWRVFNDPTLDTLVDRAYQQNLPLRIAGIRILQARAQLGIAVGEQYPQLQQGRGAWTYTSLSENSANTQPIADLNYGEIDIGFDAAWELDIWGKFRRAVESSLGNLEASIANYDDILVSLTAEVARAYVLIRTIEARLEVARENVTIQQRSLGIADARFKGGEVTELDVQQARALLADTQALIPRLEATLRQAKNALATLLGTLPGEIDNIISKPTPIPAAPAEVTVGIPAELLRRRPDIRLAERQIAAQSALIGVAKADLYPHFRLFGSIGLRASDAALTAAGFPGGSSYSDLFDSDSLEWFGGPAFSWDILNYGRIKNRVRIQDARFQELAVNYQNTVLRAAQDVEDAMVAFLRAQDETRFLTDGVNASQRSVDLSLIQYREGLAGYQRVLDAQRSLAVAQDRLTATTGEVAFNLIAMYKALGGGWEIRAGKDFVPEATKEEMRKRTNWGRLLSPEAVEPPSDEDRMKWRWPDF